MDTNAQIIADLRANVGIDRQIDFMNIYQGVPLVFKGRIRAIHPASIVFEVQPPDSICLQWDRHTLLLHDIFMSGIQGRVLAYDPRAGEVELGDFSYADRGFGDRTIVRVEPKTPIPATLIGAQARLPASVIDVSLTGFGVLIDSAGAGSFARDQAVTLEVSLGGAALRVPATVLGVFQAGDQIRLAVTFTPDFAGQGLVTRYISQRRAEIRHEIQQAFQQATGQHA